jgi:orotate phosphoribosyltransferase
MDSVQIEVTKKLLEINTIKIQPENPFTWASGWNSPIYCDNRKTLSYPAIRTYIRDQFVDVIKEKYPEAEVIAGVATGAIAIGALVADVLGLPFVYVRAKPKGHGLENMIEGDLDSTKKVVMVEDLVSTGISSLKATEAVRNYGADVIGMVAIFTYNFPIAQENFEKANVDLTTLSNYHVLIDTAVQIGEITANQVDTLMKWREAPDVWGK